MRLYTFEHDGRRRIGVEHNNTLVDLAAASVASGAGPLPSDMLAFIQAGDAALSAAQSVVAYAAAHPEGEGLRYPMDAVIIVAPILNPGKMLGSGVNYRGHKEENPNAVLPETPGFFVKLNNAIIGPGAPIVHPKMTQQLDYEVEFTVVIGKRLRKANEEEAMAGVLGYTIMHDISARDVQMKAPAPNQITLGKNFDTFAPLGPCIVTADELPQPGNVRLRTLLNGQVMQDGSTSDWLFPLPYLLSFTSHIITLEPGDIITTGTPAGVGLFQKPPVFLKPGDVVRLEVEGIGVLENPVVAEA